MVPLAAIFCQLQLAYTEMTIGDALALADDRTRQKIRLMKTPSGFYRFAPGDPIQGPYSGDVEEALAHARRARA